MSDDKEAGKTGIQLKSKSSTQNPLWPWVLFGVFALLFVIKPLLSRPSVNEGFDHLAFGKLPVLLGGRIKPLDSVARNSLLLIAGQQRIALEGNGPNKEWGDLYELSQKADGTGLTYQSFGQKFYKRPKKMHPTQWLMEVMMEPDVADKRFIFQINHPELLGELQLENLGVDKSGLRFYNFEQMQPFVMLLHKKKQGIGQKDSSERDPYERAAFKLAHALEVYIQLRYSLQPNFLALSEGSDRPSGIEDYAADLQKMEVAGNELREYLTERKAALNDGEEEWPHIFAALEWHAKQGKLDTWETEGTVFERGSRAEADTLGKLFFEVERSGGVTREDYTDPAKEEELVQKIRTSLQLLAQRNEGVQSFAGIAHVIQDFLQVDDEAQGKIARYLLLVEGPLQTMASRANLMMIPPSKPGTKFMGEGWEKTAPATLHGIGGMGKTPESVRFYATMSSAFDAQQSGEPQGDPQAFNKAVANYRAWLGENGFTAAITKADEEHFFNTFAPFARAQGIYVIALLLACFSWLKMSRGLINSAFYLIGLAFVLHTAGLIFRMYLEGRPPVTNLYSSAVFCGWGAVLLGWILDKIYRNGIGSSVAALVGFSTLIIANHLAKEGDTMEMMRAVLDTNLWLATHVVIITIGYSATFLAGFLAIIYVVRGVFTPSLGKEIGASLARMIYGIVCFATLFSFVGTVLGGIWADQSWGRFWGWDSKENGALMIVVWNAIILHCRWGGFVKDRGLVVLALVGNIVTAWSWFGVNMLGIGLHSYGFMDSAFHTLKWFAVTQILLMMAACQPMMHWVSGASLAKTHDRTISMITAGVIGIGILLQIGAFFIDENKGGLMMYLAFALVSTGLLLSFLPSHLTGSTPNKTA